MSHGKHYARSHAEQQAMDDVIVIDHGKESENVEAAALRLVLDRIRRDNYALQQALSRCTEERDQWREAYYRTLREKAEWIARTTPTTGRSGPLTN